MVAPLYPNKITAEIARPRERIKDSNKYVFDAVLIFTLKYTVLVIIFIIRHLFFQEDGLSEVNTAIESDHPKVEILLRQVLEDLSTGCTKYVNILKASATGQGTGKTKLDKERLKLCQKEIVSNFNNKLI